MKDTKGKPNKEILKTDHSKDRPKRNLSIPLPYQASTQGDYLLSNGT